MTPAPHPNGGEVAPFTPEQEARLREIVREEVAYGVAAGVGDMDRILLCLDYVRAEMQLPDVSSATFRERLLFASRLATDQANAERGITTNFADLGEGRRP